MIRAVLLDLDNTLVLEDAATLRALRNACDTARDLVDPERLAEQVARVAERLWRDLPTYSYADRMGIWWGEALWGAFAGDDAELARLRALLPDYRVRVFREGLRASGISDDKLALRLAERYRVLRRADQFIDPDAERVLADLARDHALALVTNGAPDVQREKLAGTPFERFFRAIVISCEVGVAKPDPRIFEIALERIGAIAAETAMVGDSLRRDVAGAKAAGVRAIWLDRGLWSEGSAPDPDARISSLSEVRSALDALAPAAASPGDSRALRPEKARGASRGRASRREGP